MTLPCRFQRVSILRFLKRQKIGLVTFASVFDQSLDIIDRLNVPAYKIASGDITHLPS